MFHFFSSDAYKGQIPGCLLRPPEAGAGEGVPLQSVHHHQEKSWARKRDRPLGETGDWQDLNLFSSWFNIIKSAGENLVPKPESKRAEKSEEAGRRDAEGQTRLAESGSVFTTDGPDGSLPSLLYGTRDGTSPWPSATPSLPPGPAWGPTLWADEIWVRKRLMN